MSGEGAVDSGPMTQSLSTDKCSGSSGLIQRKTLPFKLPKLTLHTFSGEPEILGCFLTERYTVIRVWKI